MNQVVIDIWPYIIGPLLAALAVYIGFIHKLRIKVAILLQRIENVEGEVKRVDKRVDRKSEQFDKILEAVGEIKSDLAGLSSELRTSLELLKEKV